MRCYCKILHISYKDHVTNEEVHAKIQQATGPHEDLLTITKRCRLQWYGHVSCSSGPVKAILQGTAKGRRRQGRQRKRLEDTPGVQQVPKGSGEQGKMEKTGYKIFCGAPTTLAVKGLMMMMMTMMVFCLSGFSIYETVQSIYFFLSFQNVYASVPGSTLKQSLWVYMWSEWSSSSSVEASHIIERYHSLVI